jgi:predicted HAD superfamily phosphohydrolase
MKELQAEEIGIKKISKIEGDKISFEGADFTKEKGDLLMKVEAEKAEGQDELVKKLGDMKSKKPEDIAKVGKFVDFISDEANKDKVAEIEKIIGGESQGA